jgi:hypothetical protein
MGYADRRRSAPRNRHSANAGLRLVAAQQASRETDTTANTSDEWSVNHGHIFPRLATKDGVRNARAGVRVHGGMRIALKNVAEDAEATIHHAESDGVETAFFYKWGLQLRTSTRKSRCPIDTVPPHGIMRS